MVLQREDKQNRYKQMEKKKLYEHTILLISWTAIAKLLAWKPVVK